MVGVGAGLLEGSWVFYFPGIIKEISHVIASHSRAGYT